MKWDFFRIFAATKDRFMGEMTGCNLLNTKRDGRMPSEFTSDYHVHIIVRQGEMRFSDGKQTHVSQKDDLVIWQMSNAIQEVCFRPSCIGVDHILCHLRTRFVAQRPVEDADRGCRPDELRNSLTFLAICEEIARQIAI